MCGVSFLWNEGAAIDLLQSRVETSLQKIAHRGPDARSFERLSGGVIGHVRLSIIDLSTSNQPMVSPCGRYYLAFNGEIYNFQEVRESLKHVWQFKTNGDTEVLLAGLIHYGVE